MSRFGYIVPPGRKLGQTRPLIDYFVATLRISFRDYFK